MRPCRAIWWVDTRSLASGVSVAIIVGSIRLGQLVANVNIQTRDVIGVKDGGGGDLLTARSV